MTVCHPSPAQAIKVMAGQIGDRDNPVRTAALNSIVMAYNILGDQVYKYVGKVSVTQCCSEGSGKCCLKTFAF